MNLAAIFKESDPLIEHSYSLKIVRAFYIKARHFRSHLYGIAAIKINELGK
jgi:hypothetical protein